MKLLNLFILIPNHPQWRLPLLFKHPEDLRLESHAIDKIKGKEGRFDICNDKLKHPECLFSRCGPLQKCIASIQICSFHFNGRGIPLHGTCKAFSTAWNSKCQDFCTQKRFLLSEKHRPSFQSMEVVYFWEVPLVLVLLFLLASFPCVSEPMLFSKR